MSSFYRHLEEGLLSRPNGICGLTSYFGVGDDAYANKEYLITPWPGRDLPTVKDNYNYWQSRLRIVVECAFGRLTKRWGCLWRSLSVPMWKVPRLVTALMKLHNLISTHSVRILRSDLCHFIKKAHTPCVFTNSGGLCGAELHEQRARRRVESQSRIDGYTRSVVTDLLRGVGVARPPHSRYR